MDTGMPHHFLWRVVLIVIVCVALASPARADSFETAGKEIVAGIIIVSAGIAVLVTYLILHRRNHRSAITGCVTSAASGMNVTDEKDKRTYAVSGDPVGIKSGDRMTFEGKRRKGSGGTPVFEAHSVTKDFGACQP